MDPFLPPPLSSQIETPLSCQLCRQTSMTDALFISRFIATKVLFIPPSSFFVTMPPRSQQRERQRRTTLNSFNTLSQDTITAMG